VRGHVVVVLNWFGHDHTMECVDSLLSGSPDVTVLVVDNGSFDGVLEALSGRARLETLQLPENTGFTGGMNRGVARALEEGAHTITILNNDTIVPPGAMRSLRLLAGGHRAVSPTVMYRDDPEEVWFAGGSLDMPDGYPHHSRAEELGACVDGLRTTELLAGCCITASADVWRSVGLLDDRFFLNFEDSEWSLRAREKGIELAVACDVHILHAVSASFRGDAATLGSYYFLRNGLLFSRLAGAGPRARARFLRRFGLAGKRRASTREKWRSLVIMTWAACAYLLGRYGEAPPALRELVRRWRSAN